MTTGTITPIATSAESEASNADRNLARRMIELLQCVDRDRRGDTLGLVNFWATCGGIIPATEATT